MRITLPYQHEKSSNLDVSLSHHCLSGYAEKRISQREINSNMKICLDYNKILLQKAGSWVYFMTNKICRQLRKNQKQKKLNKVLKEIKDMVVILGGDSAVLTTYKNKTMQQFCH